jgi:hypothetical protein
MHARAGRPQLQHTTQHWDRPTRNGHGRGAAARSGKLPAALWSFNATRVWIATPIAGHCPVNSRAKMDCASEITSVRAAAGCDGFSGVESVHGTGKGEADTR